MGDSLPPPAAVDLVGSYARAKGADVEIVLWEPSSAVTAGHLVVRRGRVAVPAPVRLVEDAQGRRLVAQAPRAQLSDGTWALTLRSGESVAEPVGARLLVQGDRPLVLLWGARGPKSQLPAPRPVVSTKSKVTAAAGRALDGALAALPAERADAVRSKARQVARRLLS